MYFANTPQEDALITWIKQRTLNKLYGVKDKSKFFIKMKKIKLNTAKLQLNKEKIAALTIEESRFVKGGGSFYAMCNDYTNICDTIVVTVGSLYCFRPVPANTGCDECGVCPRPW